MSEESQEPKVYEPPKNFGTYAEGTSEELWHADLDCEHDVRAKNSGGVACIKCGGWFCY